LVGSCVPEEPKSDLRTDSGSSHQLPSLEEQVAEGEQGEELRAVLREAAVAGRELPELALGHLEGMLDAAADIGDEPVDVLIQMMQRAPFGAFLRAPRLCLGLPNAASRAALT
jgi:hypothetical protein